MHRQVVSICDPARDMHLRLPVYQCAFGGYLQEPRQDMHAPMAFGPDGYHVHPARCTRSRFVRDCYPAMLRLKVAHTWEQARRVREHARLAVARATTLCHMAQFRYQSFEHLRGQAHP